MDNGKPFIKKKFGQHFLRVQSIADHMIEAVHIDKNSSIMEIGCGDGFLTKTILRTSCARLWVFEIDPEWVEYIKNSIRDARLTVFEQDVLQTDFALLEEHKPWILLANLPYQISFPLLYRLQEYRSLFKEGVIMVQKEVAQKVVKDSGRGFGKHSLFFQYYFDLKLLDKVPPSAFVPPPKIFSRLIYFKPKDNVQPIERENEFWDFIAICFKYPRRTLKNNIIQTHINCAQIEEKYLGLRAQQMTIDDFLAIWKSMCGS